MTSELSDARSVFEKVILSTKFTRMIATVTLSTMLADTGGAARPKLVDVHELTYPAS